jgi:NitT/TauT family transport system substrate-binding protein
MRMARAAVRALRVLGVPALAALALACAAPATAPTSPPAAAPGRGPAPSAAAPVVAAAPAQESPPTVVRQVWGAVSGSNILVWLVPELGLDRKHGLKVELAQVDGGGRAAIQSLLAGEADSVVINMDAIIAADLEGADLQVVGTGNPYLLSSLYAISGIGSVAELRGKAIAVSRLGSLSDFAARYMAKQNGLEPDQDVAILQTGSVPNVLAALETRQIPAAAMTPPQSLIARNLGFAELTNTYGTPYVTSAVTFARQTLRERPDVPERYLQAWLEAIAVAKRDRAAVLAVMRQYMQIDDEDILNQTYDLHVQQLLPQVPRIPVEGVRLMLDELGQALPKARAARPEEFYDNSLLDQLDSSGYVAGLYR